MRAGPTERWRLKDRVALSIIGLVSSLVVMVVGFLLLGRQPQMGAKGQAAAGRKPSGKEAQSARRPNRIA